MYGMFLEFQAFADTTCKWIETVWCVWLPVRIAWSIVQGYASGVVAPVAIVGVTSVFTLRAFVTVGEVHRHDSFR
jgi:hypothetical protein